MIRVYLRPFKGVTHTTVLTADLVLDHDMRGRRFLEDHRLRMK